MSVFPSGSVLAVIVHVQDDRSTHYSSKTHERMPYGAEIPAMFIRTRYTVSTAVM